VQGLKYSGRKETVPNCCNFDYPLDKINTAHLIISLEKYLEKMQPGLLVHHMQEVLLS